MAEEKKTRRPSAKKRDIQNEKQNLRNRSLKSKIKTAIRSFEKNIAEKKEPEAKIALNMVYSLIDKGVKKKIFKLNKASRIKATLTNRI